MRILVRILLLLLLVVSVGCSGSTVSGLPVRLVDKELRMPGSSPPPPLPLTSLDKEAARLAIAEWKPTRTGNGDSYFVCQIRNEHEIALNAVFELKGLSVVIDSHTLTDADRLNGWEWRGTVWLDCDAVRSYIPKETKLRLGPNWGLSSVGHEEYEIVDEDTTWSEWRPKQLMSSDWRDDPADITIVRQNGEWRLESSLNSPGRTFGFKKVDPSDLPR